MSRKTKIFFITACAIGGLIAFLYLAGGDEGEVSFTLSPVSSNRVLVTITNSSTALVEFCSIAQTYFPTYIAGFPGEGGNVQGHSARTIELMPQGTNQWRLGIMYGSTLPGPYGSALPPFAAPLRAKIKNYAVNHDWKRVSRWMDPMRKSKDVWGPMMLGNQPVESGLK